MGMARMGRLGGQGGSLPPLVVALQRTGHKRKAVARCGRPSVTMDKDRDRSTIFFIFPWGYQLLRGAFLFVVLVFLVQVVLQIPTVMQDSPSAEPSPAWSVLAQWDRVMGGAAAYGGGCVGILAEATSRLRDAVVFLPLTDAKLTADGETYFMPSLNDTFDGEEAQHLRFPSPASGGRLLCLAGNHTRDGTKNSYALAWLDALPHGAVLLPGLTFVSDSFYEYTNLWHGLGAVVPFVSWYKSGGCKPPARWVLYKRGELQTHMGPWVRVMTEAAMGQEMRIETFEEPSRPTCFEEAVVFRHNEGVMSMRKRREAFDMLRCKARALCNATSSGGDDESGGSPVVRMTVLMRTGARSFKNESTVIEAFRRACAGFGDCRLTVAWAQKLESFCDQVKLMSDTDVLASPHGAQLTNMIFMDQNSSVMEFIPNGWLERAGPGQYVYHWLAAKSGMRHQGAWRDPTGVACDLPKTDPRCFSLFYKSQLLGHDEAYFVNWTTAVLAQVREYKLSKASTAGGGQTQQQQRWSADCPCGG